LVARCVGQAAADDTASRRIVRENGRAIYSAFVIGAIPVNRFRPDNRPFIHLEPGITTMCGIVGVVSNAPVNQLIYDALLLLQHRGQDAAGIVTQQERKFFMHKAQAAWCATCSARATCARCPAASGLGQVRYPTAGERRTARKKRSRSTSTPRSASCWCTTAT
jgi:hypothetical protein